MRKNNKLKKKTGSDFQKNIIGIILPSIISIIVLFALTAVISLILLKSEKNSDSYIMYLYFGSALSTFICGLISSKICTLKGIFSGLISSLVYNFILTIILLFVSNGNLRADTGILFAVSTLFCVLGGIVGANTKRRK